MPDDLHGFCPCCDEQHCDCEGKFCRWCGLCERHCPVGDLFDETQPGAEWAIEQHIICGVFTRKPESV